MTCPSSRRLGFTGSDTTRNPVDPRVRANLNPAPPWRVIAPSDYESIRIGIKIGDKAAGPSSRRAHPIVVPARKLGDGEPGDGTRREKRRAWPLSGVRSRFLRTSRIVDESFMGHAWRYYSPLSRTPRTTTHGQLNVTPYNNGAACLSVLFPPLLAPSLERAGVPAGKQSRPIVARPYQRWANHRRARRAKMNGSLSPSLLLSLRSSLSAIPRVLFPHLAFGHLSLPRSSYTQRAPSVRRSVRSPLASAVVLSTLPYTLQRFNVSHGIFSPPLGFFACLSLPWSLSLTLSFFSLFVSRLNAVFLSHFYSLSPSSSPKLFFFFFFWISTRQHFFEISASYTLLVSYLVCINLFFLTIENVQPLNLESPMYFYHLQFFYYSFLILVMALFLIKCNIS